VPLDVYECDIAARSPSKRTEYASQACCGAQHIVWHQHPRM